MKKMQVIFLLFFLFVSGTVLAQWSHDPVSPLSVCNASGAQTEVHSVSDGLGGAFEVWVDRRDAMLTNADIYIQHLDQNGVALWTSNGVPVCTVTGFQGSPKACSDGAGGVYVFWQDMRNGTYLDVYGQRLNASGVAQWTSNGIGFRVLPSQTELNKLNLIPDGSGGVIVCWEDRRNGSLNIDPYTQRINSSGIALWTTNGVAVTNAANNQFNIEVVSDMAGGAIYSWVDRRTDEDIYAQRIDAGGNALWTVDGVPVGAANDFQRSPSMVSDLSGGAVVVFEDYRNGVAMRDIYGQRIDASGVPLWTTNGEIICDASSHQQIPEILNGNSGDFIIYWHDGRLGNSNEKIFMQRIDHSGTPFLLPDGVQCSPVSGDYFLRGIIPSDNGGAICFLINETTNTSYVQKFSQNGIPFWPNDGVRYTTNTFASYPHLTSDENGGCIAAFYIGNSGNENVHAQRIYDNGQFCQTPPIVDLGSDIVQCESAIVLDAGNSGLTFLWSDFSTAQTININNGGQFHVQVSDGGAGCTGSDTILVTMHPLPNVYIGADHTICGTSGSLGAGNSTASSYLWSTSETTEFIIVTQSGNYSVTVSDQNGCTNSHSINITMVPYPVADIGGPYTTCGETITLDAGNPGASFLWASGETSQSINVTASGNYSVAVTENGCTVYSGTTVTNSSISVSLGADFNVCGEAVLDAGNSGATYNWNTGESTQTITVNSSGNYAVTVSNTAGCTASSDVDVTILEIPSAEIGPASMEVCDGDVLTFDIVSTTGVLNYSITNAFQSSSFSALTFTYNSAMPPVLVQCDVVGQNGCTSQDIVTLVDNTLYNMAWIITNVNTPSFDLQALSIPSTADNWYWDFGDGTIGAPITSVSHTYTVNGSYDICLIALNECDSIAECINVNVTGVGISDQESLGDVIQIHPTLSQGLFQISNTGNDTLLWNVLDVTGRNLLSGTLSTGKQTIDLGFASGGIYFVRIGNGRDCFVQKIMLEK